MIFPIMLGKIMVFLSFFLDFVFPLVFLVLIVVLNISPYHRWVVGACRCSTSTRPLAGGVHRSWGRCMPLGSAQWAGHGGALPFRLPLSGVFCWQKLTLPKSPYRDYVLFFNRFLKQILVIGSGFWFIWKFACWLGKGWSCLKCLKTSSSRSYLIFSASTRKVHRLLIQRLPSLQNLPLSKAMESLDGR